MSTPLRSEVSAMERERLEALAAKPNTQVLEPTFDSVRDPWPVARLRPVMEGLVERVLDPANAATDPFRLRKACLEDEEVLAFKKQHLQLFLLLTDREQMAVQKNRDVVKVLLHLREQVESGRVPEGHEADAMATSAVMEALGGTMAPAT